MHFAQLPDDWPTHRDTLHRIAVHVLANARKHERLGAWIERIGWPKFFELTGIEFTKYHIDDFKHAGETFNRSLHFRQR